MVRRRQHVRPAQHTEKVEPSTKGRSGGGLRRFAFCGRSHPIGGSLSNSAWTIARTSSAQIAAVMRASESCSARSARSLGLLRGHGSLHLSAADGGTTMPELARCVQVRHVVRGSAPSGLRSGPHVRGSGRRIAVDSSPLAGGARLSQFASGNRVAAVCPKTRGAPNQGHSRTPAKGSRCSTWPTLPFGSAASVLPS